jgi:cell division FtsZ-interacting protein ZapD
VSVRIGPVAVKNTMAGTMNQVAWAEQIKEQVNKEFDRVANAMNSAARKQVGQDRTDTHTLIVILEDKRREVMANEEAGYFIRDWQELHDQVRQMICPGSPVPSDQD